MALSGDDAPAESSASHQEHSLSESEVAAAPLPAAAPSDEQAVADDGQQAQIQACLAQIEAAEAVVEAATSSADSWRLHVQAQVDLDSGTSTREETRATWAQTKANGPSDVAAFTTAQEVYVQQAGSCDGLAAADPVADAAVAACLDRAAAADAAAAAATAVVAEWVAHLEMMADKEHIDDYGAMWRAMVAAAPTNLAAFAAAQEALASAPACSPGA